MSVHLSHSLLHLQFLSKGAREPHCWELAHSCEVDAISKGDESAQRIMALLCPSVWAPILGNPCDRTDNIVL